MKLCECGCGEVAPIAKRTTTRYGYVKGQPVRFVLGHAGRMPENIARLAVCRPPQAELARLAATKGHGMRGTPTHNSWRSMIQRCTNSNHIGWRHYGGRGVAVCARWRSFENFLADMGERPEGLSLDRIDVDGNYEPGNCRWATRSEQRRNRRAMSAAV